MGRVRGRTGVPTRLTLADRRVKRRRHGRALDFSRGLRAHRVGRERLEQPAGSPGGGALLAARAGGLRADEQAGSRRDAAGRRGSGQRSRSRLALSPLRQGRRRQALHRGAPSRRGRLCRPHGRGRSIVPFRQGRPGDRRPRPEDPRLQGHSVGPERGPRGAAVRGGGERRGQASRAAHALRPALGSRARFRRCVLPGEGRGDVPPALRCLRGCGPRRRYQAWKAALVLCQPDRRRRGAALRARAASPRRQGSARGTTARGRAGRRRGRPPAGKEDVADEASREVCACAGRGGPSGRRVTRGRRFGWRCSDPQPW